MTKLNEGLVTKRLMVGQDHGLVYNSLLKTYERTGHGIDLEVIRRPVFFNEHETVVRNILQRSVGICAVSPDDPDQILAYILFENHPGYPVLHFVYTKQSFRQMGLANYLLSAMREYCDFKDQRTIYLSHLTFHFKKFMLRKAGYEFNPYLLGEFCGTNHTERCEAG